MSRAIIDALARPLDSEDNSKNWMELEAMEKLLRAKEYKKKGLMEMAMNSFEEICKDASASAKTRLEAIKVICSEGEEHGDPTVLESLADEMKLRGEKECEEIILTSLRRIKGEKNS